MAQLVAAEVVRPQDLDPASKDQLASALYALHAQIFAGGDRQGFVAYVIDSSAEETWIQLYRTTDGALGGYLALHFFERQLGGKTVMIVRAETGILREHRGANIIMSFGIERLARYMLRHPGRPVYFLGSLIHPSSYTQLSRYADRVWPNAEVETPADIAALLVEMGGSFGLEQVDGGDPLVRKVCWSTRDAASDRAHWQGSENAAVRFFLKTNPGYGEGHGLLTLVEVTAGAMLRGALRYAGAKLAKRARALVQASSISASRAM